jgi:energy-coupling factor transporter ATP-binding protein EcfA2
MHTLVLGRTGSGKTTLLRQLGGEFRRAGLCVLTWSSIPHEFDGIATRSHRNFGEFMADVFSHSRCAVIVDEAGEVMRAEQVADSGTLATRSRHLGHRVFFSAQRATGLLAPLVRDQCSSAYVFRVSKSDARALADEFAHEELLAAPGFRPGEYLRVDFNGTERRNLFLSTQIRDTQGGVEDERTLSGGGHPRIHLVGGDRK